MAILNILGIFGSVYCAYYQTIVLFFTSFNQSADHPNTSVDTFAQILTILICLIFLLLNIKSLIKIVTPVSPEI